MKKSSKFELTVLLVILAGALVTVCTNQWLEVLVRKQLDKNIAAADSLIIRYGDVDVSAFTGKAKIKDVYFSNAPKALSDTAARVEASVQYLSLDGINYYSWLVNRQVRLVGLTIFRPTIKTQFKHDLDRDKGLDLKSKLENARTERLENALNVARIFLDDAVVSRISIRHANVQAAAFNDSLRISVPEFNMAIYDLGYNIKDRVPHYNDSVFHFLFKDVSVYIPEADMHLRVNSISAEPNGIIEIDSVDIKSHLVSREKEPLCAGVRKVRVGGFDVAKFNTIKQMEIKNIHLYDPFVSLSIDEMEAHTPEHKETTRKELNDIKDKLQTANLDAALEFITGLDIDTIQIHDAQLDMQSIVTAFNIQADSLSLSLYGIGYSLIDDIPYHYNDSVYQFRLGYAHIITPDSLTAIETSDIRYDNGDVFSIGKTHIYNIVDKWQLAHEMGDVPSTWIDMTINSVRTSSKNIVAEAFTVADGFYLDTLYADIQSMSVFRDNRYSPEKPFRLPQSFLLNLTYPFVVHRVNAGIRDLHIEMALTDKCVGMLDLGPVSARVNNVTAMRDSTISVLGHCKIGYGSADAKFDLTVNPACDWHINLKGKNLDLHFLDAMLYPVVGMKVGCEVDSLVADYKGDTALAIGTFCMVYDSLTLHAFKDSDSPFAIISDLSGLINSAGKTLLHKRNPMHPWQDPVAYQVKWKNDVWKNPALFYLGPVINGCIETVLPGLFLHKRVKEDKTPTQEQDTLQAPLTKKEKRQLKKHKK